MSQEVREPQQKRSIDKKNRIIEAGYELFAKDGYFNTNTSEIAKKAGVSTGIVYGYFHDKRDILIEVLDIYVDNVFYPVFEMFDKITAPVDFDFIITHSIDNAVTVHENNAAIHEALHSLSSTDKTVRDKFMALENDMTMSSSQNSALWAMTARIFLNASTLRWKPCSPTPTKKFSISTLISTTTACVKSS